MLIKTMVAEKRKMMNVRATDVEVEKMQKKADKYCGGNLSEWIRYAAIKHNPCKKDILK